MQRVKAWLIAVLLGVLAAGAVLIGAVNRSPVGVAAGVLALGAPYLWLRGDQLRVETVEAGRPRSYGREALWALLAVALLFGCLAVVRAAAVRGW